MRDELSALSGYSVSIMVSSYMPRYKVLPSLYGNKLDIPQFKWSVMQVQLGS